MVVLVSTFLASILVAAFAGATVVLTSFFTAVLALTGAVVAGVWANAVDKPNAAIAIKLNNFFMFLIFCFTRLFVDIKLINWDEDLMKIGIINY